MFKQNLNNQSPILIVEDQKHIFIYAFNKSTFSNNIYYLELDKEGNLSLKLSMKFIYNTGVGYIKFSLGGVC